jgi:hypothetical protein
MQDFLFFTVYRLTLETTQWVLWAVSQRLKQQKLIAYK